MKYVTEEELRTECKWLFSLGAMFGSCIGTTLVDKNQPNLVMTVAVLCSIFLAFAFFSKYFAYRDFKNGKPYIVAGDLIASLGIGVALFLIISSFAEAVSVVAGNIVYFGSLIWYLKLGFFSPYQNVPISAKVRKNDASA